MSEFYTNFFSRGNKIYVTGYKDGKRFQSHFSYKPYLFHDNKNGQYKTIEGKSVSKKQFDSIKEAKDFVSKYKDVENFNIYGLDKFHYAYINDKYNEQIDFDINLIKIATIDIECAADQGFPDINLAEKEITAITLRSRGHSYIFGCGNFTTDNETISYFRCFNEKELLLRFIDQWKELEIDIVTGWNIMNFDIPYTINRIKNLFEDDTYKNLSPFNLINDKEEIFHGKTNNTYEILGISILDYLQIYRKFIFGNRENFRLDFIAEYELGEKKLDYSEYGSLLNLYKNNFQKFIEYNNIDTILVDKLEDKLKFIELVMTIAYDAKANFSDTLTTITTWDCIIHTNLLRKNIVVPMKKHNNFKQKLVGGHVQEPIVGLHKWVVGFDAKSLYPSLIQHYNISPETFVKRLVNFFSIDDIIHKDIIIDKKYSYTANGCCYSKDRLGFIPELMRDMMVERDNYKSLMIEQEKKYEKTKLPQDKKLISRYDNFQMAKKIQLNSLYGALSNEYFRWFSFNNAEAITLSGQLSIRWIAEKMNKFINNVLKTNNNNYVVYSDTDSIYVSFEKIVEKLNIQDELKIVQTIDKFCEQKIKPFMKECFDELSRKLNSYGQFMFMKRETISSKGIWKAKKMYMLNVWNKEGVQYSKPKLKLVGIQSVRSSVPKICRDAFKKSIDILMNGDEQELIDCVTGVSDTFMAASFNEVASPIGVNGMDVYYDSSHIYKKGSPIHVKGALLFNDIIKTKKMNNIPPIMNGDKIKYCYLKMPNPIHDKVISCSDELPDEFGLDKYIDKKTQFDKTFVKPMNELANLVGWNIVETSTLEGFFE